jgi:hypothetical protein
MIIKFLSILKNHFTSALEISLLKQNINTKYTPKTTIFIIRFFYSFPFIRNLIKSKNNNDLKSNNFFENPLSVSSVLGRIENDGYFISKIDNNKINTIKQEFKKNYFTYRFKDRNKDFSKQIRDNLDLDEIINISIAQKISHLTIDIDQKEKCLINEIGKSDFFLEIAKSYLNKKKITLHSYCYISNPIDTSTIEQKKNAQYFHYDCDYKKFIKIFIYLNDVDDENGPHIFVRGTHKKRKIIHLNATRLDDDDVEKNYNKQVIKFTGKAGTTIFEDTFGLHKGKVPEKKTRAMLVYEYGITPKILYDGSEIEL